MEHRLPFLMTVAKGKDGRPDVDVGPAVASYEKSKNVRSRIIEKALNVESLLTGVILTFILGAGLHSRESRILKLLVFDAEFCTFMQRRKMLSKIFNMCGDELDCLTPEEGKVLRRTLNEIILEKDKFAHGRLLIDGLNYRPWIIYQRNGEQREVIDEETGKVFMTKCKDLEEHLAKLRAVFSARSPGSRSEK